MDDSQNGTGLMSRVHAWVMHPFNADGTAFQWLLFFGLVIISAFLWNTVILLAIRER